MTVRIGRTLELEAQRALGAALDAFGLRLEQLAGRTAATRMVLEAGAPAAARFLLVDRLVDYKATVVESAPDGIPSAIAQALTDAGVTGPVLVPPGLPQGWFPDGVADEAAFTPLDLDGFAAVVTASAASCAQTGTIALDGSPDQGRRAITLVPDVHVCVVRADQVVETVPELVARLEPTRPTTFISGPSATSDIELERVEGVHGPRTLIVVLAGAGPA